MGIRFRVKNTREICKEYLCYSGNVRKRKKGRRLQETRAVENLLEAILRTLCYPCPLLNSSTYPLLKIFLFDSCSAFFCFDFPTSLLFCLLISLLFFWSAFCSSDPLFVLLICFLLFWSAFCPSDLLFVYSSCLVFLFSLLLITSSRLWFFF